MNQFLYFIVGIFDTFIWNDLLLKWLISNFAAQGKQNESPNESPKDLSGKLEIILSNPNLS